jgi:hypothetical protein
MIQLVGLRDDRRKGKRLEVAVEFASFVKGVKNLKVNSLATPSVPIYMIQNFCLNISIPRDRINWRPRVPLSALPYVSPSSLVADSPKITKPHPALPFAGSGLRSSDPSIPLHPRVL